MVRNRPSTFETFLDVGAFLLALAAVLAVAAIAWDFPRAIRDSPLGLGIALGVCSCAVSLAAGRLFGDGK